MWLFNYIFFFFSNKKKKEAVWLMEKITQLFIYKCRQEEDGFSWVESGWERKDFSILHGGWIRSEHWSHQDRIGLSIWCPNTEVWIYKAFNLLEVGRNLLGRTKLAKGIFIFWWFELQPSMSTLDGCDEA